MTSRVKGRGGIRSDMKPAASLNLYKRAEEALEFLMEHDGFTQLSKSDFAVALAAKYGGQWLTLDNKPNRQLVERVCNLTRDQIDDPIARTLFSGYVISYAPNAGGMTLFDSAGDLPIQHLMHMLLGDLQRQQAAKTVNRRRRSYWNACGHQALNRGDRDLGRVAFQIENEIDASGMVSDSLVEEFTKRAAAHEKATS